MNSHIASAILLSFLIVLGIGACFPDSRSSSLGSADVFALLPDDVNTVEEFAVGDILRGQAPEIYMKQVEFMWDSSQPMGVFGDILTIYDVDNIIRASAGLMTKFFLVQVTSDFGSIKAGLEEDEHWERISYRGEELWQVGLQGRSGTYFRAVTLLESNGYLVYGNIDNVKEVLKVKKRGSGSSAQGSENKLMQVLDSASGWYIRGTEGPCRLYFGREFRSCEAFMVSAERGDDEYLVDITHRFLFRTERRAENSELKVEDLIEKRIGRWTDVEDIKVQRKLVEVTVTGDEEDFETEWLWY